MKSLKNFINESMLYEKHDKNIDNIKEEILSFLSSTYSAPKGNQYSIYKKVIKML